MSANTNETNPQVDNSTLDFTKLQIQTLNHLRSKIVIYDYHQAFGILFDVLTDILGLAKQPDNNTEQWNEYGRALFASIAATAQHCTEEMHLCMPKDEKINDNKLQRFLCWILLKLLEDIESNQFYVDNPVQKNKKIAVTTISPNKISAIKEFLNGQPELLSSTCSQPLQPIRWSEQA